MIDAPADLALASDLVLEAVFRYQLGEANVGPDEIICLRVRTVVGEETKIGDASAALLSRFQKDYPRARAGRECRSRRGEPAVEIATGARALVLDIGPAEFRGEKEATVRGGFSRGGWETRLEEYALAREGDAWVVKKATLKRIT